MPDGTEQLGCQEKHPHPRNYTRRITDPKQPLRIRYVPGVGVKSLRLLEKLSHVPQALNKVAI
jgi:hypothetical protein